jgi:cysteine-rich repeat protein
MRRSALTIFLSGVLLGPTLLAAAPKVPVGSQFQVNTYTTGDQSGVAGYRSCGYQGGRGHAVGADAAGNFVVVWADGGNPHLWSQDDPVADGQDGSARGIFAQRYASNGSRIGGEFQVNSYTTGDQAYPRVAMNSSGEFVVVWNSQYPDDPNYLYGGARFGEIRGQRFASAGSPVGGEFTVVEGSYYGIHRYPAVAMNDSGRFVVVWDGDAGCCGGEIYGQRFDSDGSPQGGQFQVSTNAYPGGYWDESPDVIMEPGGEFVVVWQAAAYGSYCPAEYSILGRRYDSAGSPIGGEFAAGNSTNCYNAYFEVFPRLARTGGGGFVVVWASTSLDEVGGDYTDIAARRFDSAGSSVGGIFRVNTYTTSDQRCAAVAGAGDGSFVVTWTLHYDSKIGLGQQFDSSGNPVGGEFLINTNTSQGNVAHATSVAAGSNGDFVVVWTDDGPGNYPLALDGDGLGVFAQRFGDEGSFTCSPAPLSGCRGQIVEKSGTFRFREGSSPNSSSLTWRWLKGEATSKEEFGDPFTDTSYALCVYDSSPLNSQPLIATIVPPGGTCGPAAIPCWTEMSGAGPPLRYFDGGRARGGIVQIHLKPGKNAGQTRVTLGARGPTLGLPATPLTPPVTVQLQGSHGECFTATYEAFVRKNGDGRFQARPSATTSTTATTTITTTTITTTTTTLLPCGNLILNSGEECDDGNSSDGDGCSSTCTCNPATTPAACDLSGDWEGPGAAVTITEDVGGSSTFSGTSDGFAFTGAMTRSDSCATGTITVAEEPPLIFPIRATVADDCNALTFVVVMSFPTVNTVVRVP